MIPSLSLKRNVSLLETLFLTVLPHGGQRSARQNAWASMSSDNARAKARRDADAAMERAVARTAARTAARAESRALAAR